MPSFIGVRVDRKSGKTYFGIGLGSITNSIFSVLGAVFSTLW